MEFIQEFSATDWGQPIHRLVVSFENGSKLMSDFTGYQAAAVVSNPLEPGSGWIAFTDYYEGVMPRLSSFSPVSESFSEKTVPTQDAFPDMPIAEELDSEEEALDEEFCFREPVPKDKEQS